MRDAKGGYRRDHLRALAQRVEVDEREVRIMGHKSALLLRLVAGNLRELAFPVLFRNGAPERIRTSDPQIRSLVLYPAELRAPASPSAHALDGRWRRVGSFTGKRREWQ